jgi:cytoskeletal protein RodZ
MPNRMYIFVKKQIPLRKRKNDMSWLAIVGLIVGGIVIGVGLLWWFLIRATSDAVGRSFGW